MFIDLKKELKGKVQKGISDFERKKGISMHVSPYHDMLILLWPGDWRKQLTNLKKQTGIMMENAVLSKKRPPDQICNGT